MSGIAWFRQLSFLSLRFQYMETVARHTVSLRLPRYAGATLLALMSAGCLTLSYIHEGSFGRLFRVAIGSVLPWCVAWLLPAWQEQGQRRWYQSYWFSLALSYLGVIVLGVVVTFVWPFVMLFLMDAGLA